MKQRQMHTGHPSLKKVWLPSSDNKLPEHLCEAWRQARIMFCHFLYFQHVKSMSRSILFTLMLGTISLVPSLNEYHCHVAFVDDFSHFTQMQRVEQYDCSLSNYFVEYIIPQAWAEISGGMKTLVETGLTLLAQAGLPHKFWDCIFCGFLLNYMQTLHLNEV